jgi:hypothetical protein
LTLASYFASKKFLLKKTFLCKIQKSGDGSQKEKIQDTGCRMQEDREKSEILNPWPRPDYPCWGSK